MDDVFDALANPIRRTLLDLLRERDGRTLSDLASHLPVTRFAVMKHLKVLEDAHLVASRKVGREKLHYLNPLPVQEIADRWISRFATPFARAMSDIKALIETQGSPTMTSPRHVFELFIRGSAEAVWDVLTDDSKTPLWQHFNMTSRTEWRVGGSITFFVGERPMIVGEILAMERPTRLSHSFSAQWSPDVAGDEPSRVTWEITPIREDACKLTLIHDDFGGDTATSKAVAIGWTESISRLKTLIETGESFPMPIPAAPSV